MKNRIFREILKDFFLPTKRNAFVLFPYLFVGLSIVSFAIADLETGFYQFGIAFLMFIINAQFNLMDSQQDLTSSALDNWQAMLSRLIQQEEARENLTVSKKNKES